MAGGRLPGPRGSCYLRRVPGGHGHRADYGGLQSEEANGIRSGLPRQWLFSQVNTNLLPLIEELQVIVMRELVDALAVDAHVVKAGQ